MINIVHKNSCIKYKPLFSEQNTILNVYNNLSYRLKIENEDYKTTFILTKVKRSDTGIYVVTAKNSSGTDQVEVDISVLSMLSKTNFILRNIIAIHTCQKWAYNIEMDKLYLAGICHFINFYKN